MSPEQNQSTDSFSKKVILKNFTMTQLFEDLNVLVQPKTQYDYAPLEKVIEKWVRGDEIKEA